MKNICFFILSVLIATTGAIAQTPRSYTIKGAIVDSATMKEISFATVALKDTSMIKAVAAEANGKFSMTHNKAGKYTVIFSFVGYEPVEREVVLDQEKVVDIGSVLMSEGVQIGEVVVMGQLITSDIDKTTYNTAVDPETPSLTALEMMRKVPMLSVDGEDNLKLKDQDNYKILVNGKTNTMMSKNYKEVLRSMPASSIKNIEVITNPPAKYDAEGIGGIINIITVRKTYNSYNGSLSLRGDQFGGVGGGGYIATALGKFDLSANVGVGYYPRPGSSSWSETVNEKSEEARYATQVGESSNLSRSTYASVDASYTIDTFNLISLSFWGHLGGGSSNSFNRAEYMNAQHELQQGYDNNNNSNNGYGFAAGNIDWQRTFMKPDQSVTVSYRMDMNPGNRNYVSDLVGFGDYPDRHQRSTNTSLGAEHTFQADYFDPLTKEHNIEAGVKMIFRPNTSNTINEKMIDGDWIEDLDRKNDLDYMQYIISGYGGYHFKIKKFGVKVGLRAEYTMNTGTFKLRDNYDVFARYFNVVPYLTLSFKPSESQTLRMGYTQRLQRPGIWYLNPYVNDEDPMYVSTGNPNLDSEVQHSLDLGYSTYSQKGNLSASLNANFGNNGIQRVTTIDDKGVMFSTYENCARRQNYSLYVYGGMNFLSGKLRFNINANVGYTDIKSTKQPELHNQGLNYGGSLSFYAALWKQANLNLNGGYYSGSISLQSNSSSYLYNSIGISQAFFKDKNLRINVNVSNPFEKDRTSRSENFGVGYSSISEYRYPMRSISFGAQWNFGKAMVQVKKARRGISNSDSMGSGGGSSSSGGGQ